MLPLNSRGGGVGHARGVKDIIKWEQGGGGGAQGMRKRQGCRLYLLAVGQAGHVGCNHAQHSRVEAAEPHAQ